MADPYDFYGDDPYGIGMFANTSQSPDYSNFSIYDDPYQEFSDPSQFLSDADIAAIRDMGLTSDTSGFQAGVDPSFLQRLGLKPAQAIGLAAGLAPALLGAAGVGQQLFAGDRQATQTVSRQVPPAGPTETGLLESVLGLLRGGQSAVEQRVPAQQQLFDRSVGQFDQAQMSQGALQSALAPLLGNLPRMTSQQWGLLDNISNLARTGFEEQGPGTQRAQRDAVSRLTSQATGQIPGFMEAQRTLADPSRQYQVDPALMSSLNTQALGASRGELPSLNQGLRDQIGRIYEGRLQDVNRFVDTGLQDALERSRARGYQGGLEVFREGAPGTIFAPTMAEAVRQRGTLAGQQAEQELALAQSLPLLGANLATSQANLGFAGNTQNRQLADLLGSLMSQRLQIPALASGLEAQRQGTVSNQLGALGGASGAFSTPMSIGITGGTNLVNLNRQLAESLGGAANAGLQQRSNLMQAGTGASGQLLQSRLGSSGTTQTATQPTSLLDAFAPTAQLLGGIGGLLRGVGSTTNNTNNYYQNQDRFWNDYQV